MKRHSFAGRLLLAGALITTAGAAAAHPGHHEGTDLQLLLHWLSSLDHATWLLLSLLPALALWRWLAVDRQRGSSEHKHD